VYGSGKPYTIPEAQYPIELLDSRTLTYIHVGEKNGQRLPAYHRLNVAVTRRFETSTLFYEVNVSLFNAYGHSAVVCILTLTHYGQHRVNDEYADLYEGLEQDSRDLNEPPSNIHGALGVFSAFSADSAFFRVR